MSHLSPPRIQSALLGAASAIGLMLLLGMQAPVQSNSLLTNEQREILGHLSIVYTSDGHGNFTNKTIRITGVNVQLVNGLGATNGNPALPDAVSPPDTVVNGVGNLIVGYNELGNPNGDDRTGSHCVVIGHGNSYASFGGLVLGRDNTIGNLANLRGGAYASVTGGHANRAITTSSTVAGGRSNLASNDATSVLGGEGNQVFGDYCTIVGGSNNVITSGSDWGVVVGGTGNTTAIDNVVVAGPVTFLD